MPKRVTRAVMIMKTVMRNEIIENREDTKG